MYFSFVVSGSESNFVLIFAMFARDHGFSVVFGCCSAYLKPSALPTSSITPFDCSVPNDATLAVLSSPKRFIMCLKIAGLSDSTQSMSILNTLGFPIFLRGVDYIFTLAEGTGASGLGLSPDPYSLRIVVTVSD